MGYSIKCFLEIKIKIILCHAGIFFLGTLQRMTNKVADMSGLSGIQID